MYIRTAGRLGTLDGDGISPDGQPVCHNIH